MRRLRCLPRLAGGALRGAAGGPRAGGEEGFTLLEVMIAAIILVTGMVSLLGLFSMALSLHRRALDQTRAALIARELVPLIRGEALRHDPEKGYSFEDLPEREVPGHPAYRYTVGFHPVGEAAGEVLAEIRIFWQARGRTRSERFRSVLVAEPDVRDLIRQDRGRRRP